MRGTVAEYVNAYINKEHNDESSSIECDDLADDEMMKAIQCFGTVNYLVRTSLEYVHLVQPCTNLMQRCSFLRGSSKFVA